MDDARVYDLNLWMVFWGVVGARVLHLIADGQWHDYVNLCTHPQLVEAVDARVQTCTSAAQCGYDYLCDLATSKCYPPKDCLAVFKLWRGGGARFRGGLFWVASFPRVRAEGKSSSVADGAAARRAPRPRPRSRGGDGGRSCGIGCGT